MSKKSKKDAKNNRHLSKQTIKKKASKEQIVKQQTISKPIIRTGVLSGVGVFAFGFGVMFLLWICFKNSNTATPFGIPYPENGDNDIVGFFAYKAATWGDAICLPMIVCLFTIFLLKNALAENKQKFPRIAFVIGGLVGAAFQGYWLWSDKTQENWSIPIKHLFNVAGWWHSIFFIIIFGLIAYFLDASWLVIKEKKSFDSADNALWGGIIFSGGLFLFLHFYDDLNSKVSHAYIFIVTFLVVIAVFILYLLPAHFNKSLFKSLLIGLVVALATAIVICENDIKGNLLVAIACGSIACAGWKTEKITSSILLVLISIFSFSVLFNYTFSLKVWAESLITLGLILLVVLYTDVLHNKENWVFFVATLLMIPYIIYLIACDSPLKKTANSTLSIWCNGVAGFVLFFIISIGFGFSIKTLFEQIVNCEKKVNNGEAVSKELDTLKTIIYFKIIVLIVGLSALFIQWFVVLIGGDFSSLSDIVSSISFVDLKMFLAIIIPLAILWLISMWNKETSRVLTITTIVLVAICGVALVMPNILFIAKEMDVARIDSIAVQVMMTVFIVFHGLGTALLLSDGFYGNTVTLRRLRPDMYSVVISTILFLLDLLICTLNVLIVVFCFSVVGLIIIGINLLVICEILPVLCVNLYKIEDTKNENKYQNKVILSTPKQGVMQDGFSAFVAQVFLILLPYVFIKCNRVNLTYDLLSSVFYVMIQGMLVVEFFIKNNNVHVLNQKEKSGIDDEHLCDWFALRKRISSQQWITFYLTIPYSLLYLAVIWFNYIRKRQEEKKGSFKDDFIYDYFDKSKYQEDYKELLERYNNIQNKYRNIEQHTRFNWTKNK